MTKKILAILVKNRIKAKNSSVLNKKKIFFLLAAFLFDPINNIHFQFNPNLIKVPFKKSYMISFSVVDC